MANNEPRGLQEQDPSDGEIVETEDGTYGPYYDFFYRVPVFTFVLPFLVALFAFYLSLRIVVSRVRGRKYRKMEKKLQAPKVQ